MGAAEKEGDKSKDSEDSASHDVEILGMISSFVVVVVAKRRSCERLLKVERVWER